MVKTDELLTTIGMTCPNCYQISDIEFHRELVTFSIPFLKLIKVGGITCKCHACGRTFKYANSDKLYRYMNKSGKAFQRSFFVKNLLALAIPIIAIIAIVAIVSTLAQVAAPILNPPHTSLPRVSDNISTPLKLYSYNLDAANQTCYAFFQLSDNGTPIDMVALNVSIRINGNLTNMKIWQYNNKSIKWVNTSHVGSMMSHDDKAQVILNLSRYHFNSTDKVELLFQIFDHTPYVHSYKADNQTAQPVNAGNSSSPDRTGKATIFGHVYLNNFTSPGITLTFNDMNDSRSIVVDNSGYYRISLLPNMPYTVIATDRDMGVLMNDTAPRTFVNNSTVDFRLHT